MAAPAHGVLEPTVGTPYSPSWVDRLQVALERSRLRLVAFYVGLPTLLFLAITGAHWADGSLPFGELVWFHAVPPITMALSLGFMHYLDRSTALSLQAFRPALRVCDDDAAALHFRLTHLPAWETNVAALWGLVVAVLGLASVRSLDVRELVILTSTWSATVEIAIYLMMWVALATFMFHSKHQLMTVRHIYSHSTQVHIFRLEPIYAFSWLTGRTPIGLIAVGYLWFFSAQPLYDSGRYLIAYQGVFPILALVVFAWPLWGVHLVLVREKRRRADDLGSKLEVALERLYAVMDANDHSRSTV